MTLRPFDRRAPKARRRLHLRSTLVLFGLAIALVAALAAGSGSASNRTTAASPTPGGTLKILGSSDIFNLDTTSAYYTVSNILERSFTRQLSRLPQHPVVPRPDQARARHCDGRPDGREWRHHPRRQDVHAAHPPGCEVGHEPGPPGDGPGLRARVQDALQPGLAHRGAGLLHEHDHRHEVVLRRLLEGEGDR